MWAAYGGESPVVLSWQEVMEKPFDLSFFVLFFLFFGKKSGKHVKNRKCLFVLDFSPVTLPCKKNS